MIFDTEQISFKNNFKFKTFKKEITFGEVERSIMKPLYKLALFYCNLIKKNESKIFEFPYLYLKLNRLCKILNLKLITKPNLIQIINHGCIFIILLHRNISLPKIIN